jgi:serine protease AprX
MNAMTDTTHSTSIRRRLRRLRHLLPVLVIVGLLVGLAPPVAAAADASKVEPSLAAAIAKNPEKRFQVIVQAEPAKNKTARKAGQEALAKSLREKDENGVAGKIRAHLSLVNGFASELTGKQILKLSKNKNVRAISGDHKVKLSSETGTLTTTTTDTTTTTTTTAALKSMQTLAAQMPSVWAGQGNVGQGVTVAVLDSGIEPHGDLAHTAMFGVDIVTATTALDDPGGHGTHVAGIVAGNGAQMNGKWKGAAPAARVVSVKVTNDTGSATYSSVIKGLQWVVANRNVLNIRVANLSIGATQIASYKDDPLAAAAELAWFSGVVVVTSAGNAGSNAGTISVPANDPYVIAVGAVDTQGGTTNFTSHQIPSWSSRGPTKYDNVQKPDLVAVGHRVVSARSPLSYIERILGHSRIVDTHYYRLSGTSMAAPVVAGAAALVIAANPALTPNQVKYVLTASARKIGSYSANTQGAGELDAAAAVKLATSSSAIPSANRGVRPSNVFARSIYALAYGAPVSWRDPAYLGRNWSTWSWESGSWDSGSWDNLLWENIDWINASWSSASWDSLTGWTSGSWESGSWDSGSWDSGSWDSGSWDSGSWDSGSWDSGGWDSGQWDFAPADDGTSDES